MPLRVKINGTRKRKNPIQSGNTHFPCLHFASMVMAGVTVRRVLRTEQGHYIANLNDGSRAAVECCNCINPDQRDISRIFLHLRPGSQLPRVPGDVLIFRVHLHDEDEEEYVSGVCWDEDCISFASCAVALAASWLPILA